MSLLDKIHSESEAGGRGKKTKCYIFRHFPELSEEDQDELLTAMRDVEVSDAAIARALSETFKEKVSRSTIQRHRNSDCSCSGEFR